ncbi:MAG: bifunctional 4-hydroxy-2-oxoglutarate aldolase/2-dehydro-3-deoxy-phosphogluconate aldolase [Clostridia bacterium]|nr:bifunctional 4-hydroxy-2-oxoglutarate aldolase/2-dehydro-3-deoxy-phosphogluconate aldolase [Clostridia bacterium]
MNYEFLKNNKIIPVAVFNNIDEVLDKSTALLNGGISAIEVTFRTDCAKDAIKLLTEKLPNMFVGAGTVLNRKQAIDAINAGAKFIVSPGISYEVIDVCKEKDIPYIPGVITPTEITEAINLGFNILKFFPSEAFGGIKTLKNLAPVFPQVKFLPTGGINYDNAKEYLDKPFIVAIGGSWMMKGNKFEIEKLTKEAVSLIK